MTAESIDAPVPQSGDVEIGSSDPDGDAYHARPRTSLPAYVHELDIRPDDIDFMGHVNNAVYLSWVQDAVIAHWRGHADADAVAAHVWIALKHEITYRRPAVLHDRVRAVVRLEQVRRESAFYDTVIKRDEDVLAQVKSRWCCLDARTLRPVRVGSDIIRRFLPERSGT